MAITLKESRAATDMAELLYDFLPGSGSAKWKGHVSFRTVAENVGVGEFWQPGSKTPMIRALLEKTLERHRDKFEPLILQIVRGGIAYRQKHGNPITPNEIDQLNGLILELGFKFPELWDPSFKTALEMDAGERAKKHVDAALREKELRESQRTKRAIELEKLKTDFFLLHQMTDRQTAGRRLQSILTRLFELNELQPRKPFRVVGEEIDGSFILDHELYLLEAKWEKKPTPESDLLVFLGKVTGKSAFSRGVFISVNGISEPAKEAIVRGKQPNFFVIDGYDLTMLLSDNIELKAFLRQRRDLLADEGEVVVPYNKLWSGSRGNRRIT